MTAQISSASTAIALGCGAADQAGALPSRGLDAAEAVVAIAPAGYNQVRQLPLVLAVVLVTVALVGLSGCAPRVWTARFYNNTSQSLNVLVAYGHDEVRYKIAPQAIGFIWIGEGPIDLGVSVFDESCRKMASRQFAASRFGLLQFGPDPVIDLSEEDAGVGPDPTLLPTAGDCPLTGDWSEYDSWPKTIGLLAS